MGSDRQCMALKSHLYSNIFIVSTNKICHLSISLVLECVIILAPPKALPSHKNPCTKTAPPATSEPKSTGMYLQNLNSYDFYKMIRSRKYCFCVPMPVQGHRTSNSKPRIRARHWPSELTFLALSLPQDLEKLHFLPPNQSPLLYASWFCPTCLPRFLVQELCEFHMFLLWMNLLQYFIWPLLLCVLLGPFYNLEYAVTSQ